ncbi:L,D-transpeptidase [Candidatus Gottesmanbacteria bacterium]|nr:L,D-transpeptidase [Candidatus Gottesmanbacteria bacterium]
MKLTLAEAAWVKLFGVLGFFVGAFFLVQPLLPALPPQEEPLADPTTLQKLIAGETLVPPTQDDRTHAQFHGNAATPPTIASLMAPLNVLGASAGEKRIEVDLTHQRVYAFEGNRKVFEFLTSTGKWGRTPTGTFYVWTKLKSTLMSGGSGATYYYLPNVPWVMFFGNNEVPASRGFSLHGTYWHNNFGHPMSHGCVNLRTEDAKMLFAWADPPLTDPKAWSITVRAASEGTKVVIYGEEPDEISN